VLDNLEDGLCLFFAGYTRSAAAILKDKDEKSKAKDFWWEVDWRGRRQFPDVLSRQ
jgi:hypothetical protein